MFLEGKIDLIIIIMVTTWPFSDPWKWIMKDFLTIIQVTDTMHAVRVVMLWKQQHIVNKTVQVNSLKLLRNYFTFNLYQPCVALFQRLTSMLCTLVTQRCKFANPGFLPTWRHVSLPCYSSSHLACPSPKGTAQQSSYSANVTPATCMKNAAYTMCNLL